MDTGPVHTDVWQVLVGRAVGTPLVADDPDLWEHISSRLNVARARPRLRPGVEAVAQTTVRGQAYVMLRSPDRQSSYVRLAPEEWQLAQDMDGSRSVAVLVGVLAQVTGKLAPDRVTRVVADLGANRMLEELPVNAFAGVRRMRAGRRRSRIGRRVLDAARGRRMVLGDVDRAMGVLYRAGGRFLFTRPAAIVAALVALVGGVLFLRTWSAGTDSLFLQSGSFATGGLLLLGLNVVALLAHELGHALATKHAGRRVPAVGVLLYFGIPSAFVDTTDIWMASRRHRLIATAAGPASALTLAGLAQVVAFAAPELAPLAFKLSFAWYINALFNLNPLMALDGYYLAMDALEINNLRARGITFLVGSFRSRRLRWAELDREARYVAAYGLAAALWTVIFFFLSTRIWRDRVSGLVAGLWHTGIGGRLLVVAFVLGLFAPVLSGLLGAVVARWRRVRSARGAARGATARLDALRASRLAALPAEVLEVLAASASWMRMPPGAQLLAAGVLPTDVLVLVAGEAEGRRVGDPPATVRVRIGPGDVLGVAEVLAARTAALDWRAAAEVRLLRLPGVDFLAAAGELLATPGVDVQAAEAALDASPQLGALTPDARLELLSRMGCVDVAPGKLLTLTDPTNAVLVGAGLLVADGGRESRAGEVLRAVADDEPLRLRTRTQTTLWRLPDFAGLGAGAASLVAAAPPSGAHGGGGHPPVTPPPSFLPAGDDEADDRLWRRTLLVLILLLLLALLSVATAFAEPTPWAEMPRERVLVEVTHGSADVQIGGGAVRLSSGGRVTAGAGDRVEVAGRSTARLVYAGGEQQVLCGGSSATVVSVARSRSDRTWVAAGVLRLERGALLVDTAPRSTSFTPMRLVVTSTGPTVRAAGAPVRFGMTTRRLDLTFGDPAVDGEAARGAVDCRGTVGAPTARPGTKAPSRSVPSQPGGAGKASQRATPGSSPSARAATPAPASASLAPLPSTTRPATAAPSPTASIGLPTPTPTPRPTPRPTPTRTAPPPPVSPAPSPSPAPAPGLSWTCSPTSLSFPAGGSAGTKCTATSTNGFSGGVTFSCENAPAGMACAPAPGSATIAAGGSATTGFTVSGGRALGPGTYQVDAVVRSNDGLIVRRVSLTVTVT